MLNWLENFIRESGVPKIPPVARRLPACLIRPCRESDLDACRRIYQLNEGKNFHGGLEAFEQSLTGSHTLYLVCEEQGEVRAMGGMNIRRMGEVEGVDLFYGMVHPDHHDRGLGTAMVLARLAILPPPAADEWNVWMHSVANGFHRRFGFQSYGVTHDGDGNRLAHLLLHLSQAGIDRCRNALSAARIPVECGDCMIPDARILSPESTTGETGAPPVPATFIPQQPSLAEIKVNYAQAIFIIIVAFVIFFSTLSLLFYFKAGR